MASLKSIEWQPIEALAQLELELEAVFITFVPPPLVAKFISLLVPLFGPIALPHLKRVRKPVGVKKDPNALSLNLLQVLLIPTHSITECELLALLKSTDLQPQWSISTVRVPKYPPLTRDCFNQWKTLWPMGFHEKVEKDQIAPGDLDMAQEWILRVHSLMEEASDTRGASNVVLFIDPITNTEKVSHVELLHVRGRHPLHHAIMTGIEDVALAERQDRLAKHTTVQYDQDSGERTKKRDLCFADDENRGKLGYLCSGMDVYVYREPCIMCAMALVHSRIRRLFFIKKKGSWGGLTRKEYAIHTHKSLNHKFKVWQAVFKEK